MRLAFGLFVNPSQTKLKTPRSKERGSVTMHRLGRANGSESLILNHAGGKYVAFIIILYRRAKASQAPENRLASINQRSKCLFGYQSVKQTQHTQTKSRTNAAKSGALFLPMSPPLYVMMKSLLSLVAVFCTTNFNSNLPLFWML